jgi:hypothetical protein
VAAQNGRGEHDVGLGEQHCVRKDDEKKPAENPRPSTSRWAPGEPMPAASRTENKAPTVTKPPASMASTRICTTDSRYSRRVP